jgi:two-component system chemotaxis response regulator CheY
MSRKYLKNILEDQGYDVHEAQDGQKAWELYQKNNVNFVISNRIMPNMNGLTQKLGKKGRFAKVF